VKKRCSICLSFSLTVFSFLTQGQAGQGQGELLRAAGGLIGVAADGEQEKAVYNIVMIQ